MTTIPALEERFLEPPGWRWHSFKHDGRSLRFGCVSPADSIPNAVVVCLPGLSEFGEKYFETARDCLSKNLAFWVFDWMGQGKSDRYLKNSQKRHSRGIQKDVDDLHSLIMGYIKHSSVHPDKGRIPLVMLAHSLGAHIGLHYLAQHQGMFECAAFSSPLVGLKATEKIPNKIAQDLTNMVCLLLDTSYVWGFSDWRESVRSTPARNYFSGDPMRNAVHNAWCLADPSLQVGGITYGWVHEVQKSCMALQKPSVLESIQTHCLLALAGKEMFVSNAAIRSAAARLPHAKLLEFPGSRHEILMETDEIRKVFMHEFFGLVRERIINRPETLKPF